MIRVTENLKLIKDLLATEAVQAGRPAEAVKLLAVSKKQPVDKILAAIAAGQRDFGENFVQEGREKIQTIRQADLIWHFIGHLQTNKTRDVAENFDWVHTIDKIKTARRLSEQRPAALGDLNICLQVNVDNEPGKSGVAAQELADLATACLDLPRVRLRGLMCLPAIRVDHTAQRVPFAKLRLLAADLAQSGISMDTLSMGMSGDFPAAIREGATIVRIGTAIFGERDAA